MSKSEEEVKKEVQNLYIYSGKFQWEKISLLILSLLAPGKFASRMFIYNKALKWLPLDPENKKHLKSISASLYDLYRKRLIIRYVANIDEMGISKFKQFCNNNKEGMVIDESLLRKKRAQTVFRLPKEGEKVRLTIPQEKIVRMMIKKNSDKNK